MSTRLVDNPNLNGQITAPDASYPDGSYLNDSTGTAGDGTPLEKSEKDDIEGFLQALRLNAVIVASGNPDTALVSDYLDAFRRLTVLPYVATLNYRIGDMTRGSDGLAYQALVANGPASTVVDPIKDATGVWLMGLAKQKPEGNLLYGGYGQITQRGLPFGGIGGVGALANQYTLDGVQVRTSGAPVARFTVRQVNDIIGQPASIQIETITPSATMDPDELVVVRLPIEAQDLQILETGTAGVKKLGIRMVIALPKSGIQPISIYNEDDNTSFPTEINVTAADTLEEFVFDIPGDPAGVIDNNAGAGLWLCIPLLAGTNFQGLLDQWQSGEKYATGNQQNQVDGTPNFIDFVAKTEVGDSTPFELVTEAAALKRAFRYFEIQGDNSNLGFGTGQVPSTNTVRLILRYSRKRVSPAITFGTAANFAVSQANGANSIVSTFATVTNTEGVELTAIAITTVIANLVIGNASILSAINTGGKIFIDSEM